MIGASALFGKTGKASFFPIAAPVQCRAVYRSIKDFACLSNRPAISAASIARSRFQYQERVLIHSFAIQYLAAPGMERLSRPMLTMTPAESTPERQTSRACWFGL